MKKTTYMMLCIMVVLGNSDAQNYVVVSGSSMPITSPSSLMVDYAQSTYDQTLEPGDIGTLTLVIKNTGSQRSENVEVSIPEVPNIRINKKFFLGTISASSSSSISVSYQIADAAPVGTHNVPILITYDGYDSDSRKVNDIKVNYDFPIKVYGNPKLTLDAVDFGDMDIGTAFDITLKIKNQNLQAYKVVASLGGADFGVQDGSAALNAAYTAASSAGMGSIMQMAQNNPQIASGLSSLASSAQKAASSEKAITVLDSDRAYVGDIASGQTVPVTFRLYVSDKATSGAYSLPLTLDYENKGRRQLSERFNVGAYISGKPQISISNVKTDPQEIHQGEKDVEIIVTVENIGTAQVENYKMTLLTAAPFLNSRSYTQTKELGMVKIRDSSTQSFFIDVAEKSPPGLYHLDFMIQYQIGARNVNETRGIQLALKDSPDFAIASPDVNVTAGDGGRIVARITNNGKKCDSVTLWVMKKSDQPFDFADKSQYIGDLDQGGSGDASIQFSVDASAQERNYIVPLEVRCTLDNKVDISSKSTRINVIRQEKSMLNVPTSLVIALLILVALAVYAISKIQNSQAKKTAK